MLHQSQGPTLSFLRLHRERPVSENQRERDVRASSPRALQVAGARESVRVAFLIVCSF